MLISLILVERLFMSFNVEGQRLASIGDYCTATTAVANDGLDNDCDNQIDEELANGVDDDGDGLVGRYLLYL